uniref:Radical SAM protein n=1 Tax=Desulfobacca acetoxidans TaxID=60893 RepID=A0A7C3UXV8_9BACT
MLDSALANFFAPRFDWLQVEVTTCCQAACTYCPHTVYQDAWNSGHLALDTFRRLRPDLKRARLVHLQGWGEPFLHPEFFTLVALARQAGCQVGTTTNGMLLDADSLKRLVDLEVGMVAFSLAGVGANHDAVRRGTRFSEVLEKIRLLREIKARKGVVVPKVHVAYMLLRSHLQDLALLPQSLEGLGVSQVVVSTLDFVAEPWLAKESLRLLTPEEYPEVATRLAELAERGRRQGMEIHGGLPPPTQGSALCPENPTRAVVVAADGAVAPCVFLNLPVRNETCLSREGQIRYRRLSFGSLGERSLPQIWRSRAYRDFRRAWARGDLPSACRGCLKPF